MARTPAREEAEHENGGPARAWYVDVLRFTAGSGLRLGELCALKWKDVDVHEGTVVVCSDETHQTKTAAERTVHVSPEAQSILERLSEARDPTGEDFVFQGPESDQLSHALTSRYFRKYRRKVGLSDDLTFHSLRHTTGSWLSMRGGGVPLRHIQDILGHSSTSVTEIYSHLAPETLDRAMDETFGSD